MKTDYINGRSAVLGDQIVNLKTGEAGPLDNITPGNRGGDGTIKLEHTRRNVMLKDCLHLEDVRGAFIAKPAKKAEKAPEE